MIPPMVSNFGHIPASYVNVYYVTVLRLLSIIQLVWPLTANHGFGRTTVKSQVQSSDGFFPLMADAKAWPYEVRSQTGLQLVV